MSGPLEPRLYLHQPAVVFAAQVNIPAGATYPVTALPYNSVTTGSYTAISPGMTLLLGTTPGASDLGRQRVRAAATASLIYVGRSSHGHHDGELMAWDNAYITVWDDRRVWAKIPYIAPDGTIYKDSALEVGDRTTNPPPVSNSGAGFAGTIDSATGVITVLTNGQNSYATADGATITGYQWNIGDGTLLGGALTDDNITATYPPGFRYVSLTVTDSNGKTHTSYVPIYARDPDNDTSFDAFQIESHRISERGQVVTVRALADMPRVTYPDGTLAMLWGFEAGGAANRDHMLIIGWLDSEEASINAGRTGVLRDTTLTILDVAGRLDTLPGFPQTIADDDSRDTDLIPEITWSYMVAPNLDKYLHYLLHWHSTALDVADFVWSGDGALYPFTQLKSDGASLWEQVNQRANAFVPQRVLTCDRAGRMVVVPDPMLADLADRTTLVQATISENRWSDIRFGYSRHPRVHWLRGSAILASSYADLPLDGDGNKTIQTVFSIAPGETPGQGVGELTQGEHLALNQHDLNVDTGHRYARANARVGKVTATLVQNDGSGGVILPWADIEPAHKTWVTLTVSSATAAQRRLVWTTVRTLPLELNIRYTHARTGLLRTVEVTLEIETSGVPGETVIMPDVPPVGVDTTPYVPPVWTVPEFGDPSVYYGDINAYILWDGAHVYRTWDLQAASPTWEFADSGISGSVQDCQYVHVDADTVGAWLMTTTAIWWCGDIMAVTPSWTNVLPIATVRAADATPATGLVVFKTMFHYWSAPGHLCVATGPLASDGSNTTYVHAYFWVTEDFGANWTQVDMNTYTFTNSSTTRGYCNSSLYAMNIYRSDPGTIYCVRSTPVVGGQRGERVFISRDLGYTWEQGMSTAIGTANNPQVFSLLHPFPDVDDPSYIVSGSIGANDRPDLRVSTNEWATHTVLTADGTAPSGYGGLSNLWRVNKRTFDNNHVLAWFRHTATTFMHLLESNDGGATWSLLYNSGLADSSIPNTGTGGSSGSAVNAARFNTPNGWPPDVDQWVLVRAVVASGSTTGVVQLTLNNFAALADKSGNLNTLLGGNNWTNGPADGFALPKIAPNI